ncbi:MAG TPA: protein kinase, partial [Chthoniobacterales bacterium]|nr:protein kinase [Chthoniobacterales bacterium]
MKTPNAETIFNKALAIRRDEERVGYLRSACGGDADLFAKVERLLQAHVRSGQFMPTEPGDSATVLTPTPLTEGPGTRIGRYKLLQQIGEGGMGVVYMAEQEEPVRRRVALKIIKLGMDTRQVVARFEAERQALALMDHPNIARVIDGGATETGRPYFVMELVQGVPITDFCDKTKLSAKERLKLFVQLCQAVQHAHQKGIIHRDIKPSNVLVTLHDGVPVPKVIDFGIAKATNQKLTEKTLFTNFATMIGTPAYMSPEQAEMSGLDIDTRTDIYALGVLLYALMTGTTPFPEKRLRSLGYGEMQRVILEEEPERPSTRLSTMANEQKTIIARNCGEELASLNNLLKGDLDWIVMKCLEKDRQRRYETANGLASDIQRHLTNEPVIARPPSAAYRFRKLVRRNRLAVMCGTAVATALLAGVAVSTWLAIKATRSEHQAVAARSREASQRAQAQAAEQSAKTEATRAESKATEARNALAASDFTQAIRLISEEKAPEAAAYLARCLRIIPSYEAAAARLATLLTYRSWCVLATPPIKHAGGLCSAEFSFDGKRVLTASWIDDTVRVWSAQTGQPLTEPIKHRRLMSAQFSPDGRWILTTSKDNTATIWDARNGTALAPSLQHGDLVFFAQFSPDGTRIVTASYDHTARVWDAQNGQPLTEPLKHEGQVFTARFSPDGKRIVTASEDKNARIWEAATGRLLAKPLIHDKLVVSAEFSPDGKRILTASWDKTARIWDAQTGQPLTGPLKHLATLTSAKFSRDGRRVVTASRDKTARVWDAESGQLVAGPLNHGSEVDVAEFSPDGKLVWTAERDMVRIWDAESGQLATEPLRHESSVCAAQFSPDGKRLLTGSADGIARVWDLKSGRAKPSVLKPGRDARGVTSRPDGNRVGSVAESHTTQSEEADGDESWQPWNLRACHSVEFSSDGKLALATSGDNMVTIWDVQSERPVAEALKHNGRVNSAHF